MNVATSHAESRSYQLGHLLLELALPAPVASIAVHSLALDSRSVTGGCLFFAVPGVHRDGREFIDAAVAAGAVAVVCEGAFDATDPSAEVPLSWRGDVPVIEVQDAAQFVGLAASRFFGEPSRSMRVAGITGTNGKSTCVSLLAQLRQALGSRAATIGTLGYGWITEAPTGIGMTTPDAISCHRILRELLDRQTDSVAMEVSSHGLVQQRLAGVEITSALFTNLSRDHLDYHRDMADYANAKARLFQMPSLRNAVINLDDEYGSDVMGKALRAGARLFTYSLTNPAADVLASRIRFFEDGIEASLRTPWGSGEIRTHLLGEFNLSNLLGVIALCCAEGAELPAVLAALPTLRPVKGRMQRVAVAAPVKAVIDYAHTPDALRQALAALRAHGQKKIHVVFGCGGDRDTGKRPQMASVAESFADRVVVTSDNPRTEAPEKIIADICAGFSNSASVEVIVDRAEAIAVAINKATAGDLVLIAGKGHEDYQILGDSRIPFDDEAHARLALRNWLGEERN